MSWKLYKFGDFLTRSKIPIEIQEDAEYKRVTIKIKHNGVSIRDFEKGKEIGTKKQFILKGGQFVLSKIDARYGAFGIAPNEVDGAIITGNFWAYDVDFEKVNIEWFNQFTNSQFFYDLCERASSGITHRKYLSENSFLNNEIYLPEINEQLKIIEEFKGNKTSINFLSSELIYQLDLVKQLRQAFLQEAMQGKLTEDWRASHPELVSGHNCASQLLANIKTEKEKLVKDGKLKKQASLPLINQNEIPFEIPESWEWCRFGELTINCDGLRIPLSKYQRSRRQGPYDYYGAQGVIDNIDDFNFDGTFVLIAEDGQNLLRKNKPVAFLAKGKFWVNNHAHVSDCVDSVTKYYISYFINSISLAPYISGKPPSQIKLKRSQLDSILIPVPTLSEQQQIVKKIDELMQFCKKLSKSIKTSQRQNEMLLQQVLREALEPKDKEVIV